jgi:hypothetical protein
MMVYIIMHNMIVEDESEEDNDFNYDQMGERCQCPTMIHQNLKLSL